MFTSLLLLLRGRGGRSSRPDNSCHIPAATDRAAAATPHRTVPQTGGRGWRVAIRPMRLLWPAVSYQQRPARDCSCHIPAANGQTAAVTPSSSRASHGGRAGGGRLAIYPRGQAAAIVLAPATIARCHAYEPPGFASCRDATGAACVGDHQCMAPAWLQHYG